MDRRLCLCSASLVLMLVSFDGCLARPWWGYRNEPVDREEKGLDGVLGQELDMLKRVLEREEIKEVERGLQELEERREEERVLEERREEERMLVEREQVERERMEREMDERLLEYGREELRRQRRREVHAQAFLERFGYLPALPRNVSHDPASTKRAVRDFQRMYHLNMTGEMDEMTIHMMEVPRCGMPDATPMDYLNISRTKTKSGKDLGGDLLIAQNYFVPGHKWKKRDLTWTLRNYHQLLSAEVTRSALHQAFKYWSDVSGLTFAETRDSNADIKMEFVWGTHQDGPGNAFDGSGGVLAHAFYPENGETHFDSQEQWTDGKKEGINLMIVAAHELGHSFGLGHSEVKGALMAPYYQGYDPNFRLHDDDVRAIQYLYGGPLHQPIPPTPVRVTDEPTVRPTQARATTKRPTTQGSNPSPPSGGQPNTCDVVYKAVTQTHDYRIYIFNGRWMWRTSEYGLDQGFPLTISTYYENPPEDITAAIFSWKTYYTYLFKGKKIWRYYGFQLVDKKTIETTGYPESPKVAIASKDKAILLVKGGNVWTFDEELLDVKDASNPVPFDSLFPGAPATFDSAVRLINDPHIYFFKGQNYYKYSEDARSIVEGYPKEKAGPWMGQACGAEPYTPK